MTKRSVGALLASFLVLGLTAANAAAQTCPVAAEDAEAEACPSFTRQLGIGGTITSTFADATAAAGVPAAAILQAAAALRTAVDLESDLHDGDHFYLRWEQPFTLDGQPTGDSRLVWAELRTKAKGTIVAQRLKPPDCRSGHRGLESLPLRDFRTELRTPGVAGFTPAAAVSV